jgi:hypothetical protein
LHDYISEKRKRELKRQAEKGIKRRFGGREQKNNKREGKKGKKERKRIHIHRPLVVVGS